MEMEVVVVRVVQLPLEGNPPLVAVLPEEVAVVDAVLDHAIEANPGALLLNVDPRNEAVHVSLRTAIQEAA